MTVDEWLEMVAWINDRFAPGWTVDKAAAYGVDLKQYDAADVWDAIQRLYIQGLAFAPNGSELGKMTVDVIRDRMERAHYEAQGIGEGTREPQTWKAWQERLGYEGLSVVEAARLKHRELFPGGCPYPACDVCANLANSKVRLHG